MCIVMITIVKEDWERYLYNLDNLEIRILEQFYLQNNQTYALKCLYSELKKKYKIKEKKLTVRLRVIKLRDMGLLYIIPKTSPLIIEKIRGLDTKVGSLILMAKERHKIM